MIKLSILVVVVALALHAPPASSSSLEYHHRVLRSVDLFSGGEEIPESRKQFLEDFKKAVRRDASDSEIISLFVDYFREHPSEFEYAQKKSAYNMSLDDFEQSLRMGLKYYPGFFKALLAKIEEQEARAQYHY